MSRHCAKTALIEAINRRLNLLPRRSASTDRHALIHLTLNIVPFVELLLIAMAKVAGVIGGVALLGFAAVALAKRRRGK